MPKKRIAATRKTQHISSFDFEDVDFLTHVEQMAFDGFYDVEIADKLNISRYEFSREVNRNKKLAQLIESARARAREQTTSTLETARARACAKMDIG